MGTDLRNLLDVLSDDLSPNSNNTYASIIAGSFFLYLGIVCMFIVILRKKIHPEEADGKFDAEMGKQN